VGRDAITEHGRDHHPAALAADLGASETAASKACVYLYRRRGVIVYVGRGASPQRALDHTSGSHNAQLEQLIRSGDYEIQIAGPYPDYQTAMQVEAALISAMAPAGRHELVNDLAGDGEKFRPLGVPASFADRQLLPPLSLTDLAQLTSGALIVRNAYGDELSPGRPRLDPLNPDTAVLIDNLRHSWYMAPMHDQWKAEPDLKPRIALSAAGPLRHRYIAAAVPIQRDALGIGPADEIPLQVDAAPDLDACGLRGRLLDGVRFTRMRHTHIIWIDKSGTIRWPRTV
jgi:hypothetical protein